MKNKPNKNVVYDYSAHWFDDSIFLTPEAERTNVWASERWRKKLMTLFKWEGTGAESQSIQSRITWWAESNKNNFFSLSKAFVKLRQESWRINKDLLEINLKSHTLSTAWMKKFEC